jgi:enolase-phosphatase E1
MSLQAVAVDIEGTTTPLAFVRDVLFPDARARLPSFLIERGGEPPVRAVLERLASEHGVHGDAALALLLRWLDEDRKEPSLKALQGIVWDEGYRAGRLVAPLFSDVVPQLRAWKASGLRLAVYSSGSVQAQRLLFAHTHEGDVSTLFDGFFDTALGPKVEAASYGRLAAALACAPADLLFLSDAPRELEAASGAGVRALGVSREGAPTPAPHRWITSFDQVVFEELT